MQFWSTQLLTADNSICHFKIAYGEFELSSIYIYMNSAVYVIWKLPMLVDTMFDRIFKQIKYSISIHIISTTRAHIKLRSFHSLIEICYLLIIEFNTIQLYRLLEIVANQKPAMNSKSLSFISLA